MTKNLLLLGSVAFSVSFTLSLLINRDIKPALISGLITVPATFLGVFIVNGKQRIQKKQTLTALQNQLYQLQRQETQLNQSLRAIATEEQTKSNINFLKIELNQLYAQIAEQRSYKQQLNQDLITLDEHRNKLEIDSHNLQTQIQSCEQRKRELYEFMQFMNAEKQESEASFHSIQVKLNQLQVEVTERQNQNEELKHSLLVINESKLQLEDTLYNLQIQIQEAELQKIALSASVSAITQEREATKINLEVMQDLLRQLQPQIVEQQNNENKLEQDLITFSKKIATKQNQPESISDEWVEFATRLNKPKLEVIKALIQQSNPNAAIKKIAEANITMPELLIDAINECALDTIGDLIIEPGSELGSVGILEEYLPNLNKVININEIN